MDFFIILLSRAGTCTLEYQYISSYLFCTIMRSLEVWILTLNLLSEQNTSKYNDSEAARFKYSSHLGGQSAKVNIIVS